jgi:phage baseplate assembly protein W
MSLDSNSSKFQFVGQGWSFPPKFNKTSKGVEIREGNSDIIESLEILLSTLPGERIYHPEYGCDLTPLLFESLTNSLSTLLTNRIKESIINFERRIIFNSAVFNLSPQDGVVYISIQYSIKTDNSRYNMVYPYYLREGTEL